MGKDIKLNSEEWCDVVFDGKNKQYGAYRLRQTSSKRHIAAFLVIVVFALIISLLPFIMGVVNSFRPEPQVAMEDSFSMSNIPIEDQIPEENKIQQETAPPPPPLKTTVKFVAPVIAKDDKVKAEDEFKPQEDLMAQKLELGNMNIKGDDKKGINMDQIIEENKKIAVEAPKEDKPFTTVEQMPSFPGGQEEMLRFIANNLKYPVPAQEAGIQGRVTIRFVVTKDGNISDVTVVRGIDKLCDNEAVRVVKSMPKWNPGKQNGRAVPVYFTLPVVFRLKQ